MSVSLDVRLKRTNKTYHEGDMVSGVVAISCATETKHDGIMLYAEGTVNLQLSAKNVGRFEAFYNSVKPMQLMALALTVVKPGKLPAGLTEVPFEFPLQGKANRSLYETYHGVFVSIQYMLRLEMKRSMLTKDISKTCEFIVEYGEERGKRSAPQPVPFVLTPQSLQNIKDKSSVPTFRITGHLDSVVCNITKPFTGELIVESCAAPIKAIELQLVRVETCGCAEGYARDATEVQNIQIGEGDVCRNLPIPIYMIFPRLFTCPTLSISNFKIEFEVNIVIIFEDNHLITENFPISLTRF